MYWWLFQDFRSLMYLYDIGSFDSSELVDFDQIIRRGRGRGRGRGWGCDIFRGVRGRGRGLRRVLRGRG